MRRDRKRKEKAVMSWQWFDELAVIMAGNWGP